MTRLGHRTLPSASSEMVIATEPFLTDAKLIVEAGHLPITGIAFMLAGGKMDGRQTLSLNLEK